LSQRRTPVTQKSQREKKISFHIRTIPKWRFCLLVERIIFMHFIISHIFKKGFNKSMQQLATFGCARYDFFNTSLQHGIFGLSFFTVWQIRIKLEGFSFDLQEFTARITCNCVAPRIIANLFRDVPERE
jgi:hypothetical protein